MGAVVWYNYGKEKNEEGVGFGERGGNRKDCRLVVAFVGLGLVTIGEEIGAKVGRDSRECG